MTRLSITCFVFVLILTSASNYAFNLKSPKILSKSRFSPAEKRLVDFKLSGSSGSTSIGAASFSSKQDIAQGGWVDMLWNDNTKLATYLTVWYLGNIAYNIANKEAANALGKDAHGHANAHYTLSFVQLLVGVLFVIPMWLTGLRAHPDLTLANWGELSPVGLWTSLAHTFSVLALSSSTVSFGQIAKAAEPVFAAATNALYCRDVEHVMVYLSMLPIIFGVALASFGELSFSWIALAAAFVANQAAAFKTVVSKGVMKKPWTKKMGPQNFYAVINILAMLCALPLVLIFEVKDASTVYQQVMKSGTAGNAVKYTLLSGLAYYIYNEASFLALDKLSPVSHSVANTLKRVAIIVVSCLRFRTPISMYSAIGSTVAVLGTFLFSLAKTKYSKSGGH